MAVFDKLRGDKGRARAGARGVGKLGRYELLHPLGCGGMAEVFKARASGPAGFERDVVVKRILPQYTRDPDFVRMFADEARILGLMHHPNVVQAYEFGEDGGTLYLALEYIEGPSLSKILRTLRAASRPMPPAIVAYVAREICRSLDYVHRLEDADGERLDVVHRDVTPSNIIVTPSGAVKLLDFGVAKFATSAKSTRAGTVKGKPAYLAPEQLQGKPIDGRVDLFALGIVMHEMLTLQHLFAGDSDVHTAKKIMEMKIPSITARRQDVPPDLERIVMRALERDRKRRFATAAEMARALDDFILASQLHVEDVADFVREIETLSGPPRLVYVNPERPRSDEAATRRDRGLRLRMTARRMRTPRFAAVAALVLTMIGLGAAFGLHTSTAAAKGTPPAATSAPVRVALPATP
jgi:eukaryotic-like serine/threonine-protein kinase